MKKQSAIYLVGHGPRREPRPIELQHVRALRYLDALETKLGIQFWTTDVFVDLNWPRTNYWMAEHFPEIVKLSEAIQQGQYDTVIVDLAPEDPRSWAPYNTMVSLLERAGAKVYNAYFDDEGALADKIKDRYGRGAESVMFYQTPGDASDFLAFFPGLVSKIGQEALDLGKHKYGDLLEPAFERLREIGERSPYASSQYPFLEASLEHRMFEKTKHLQEDEWHHRRAAGEQLFCLAPGHSGTLIEEEIFPSSHVRSSDELDWAEKRLTAELGFFKQVNHQCIAYIRDLEGYKIYGDPRLKGSLGFRVYKVRSDSVPAKKKRRSQEPSVSLYWPDFSLPDSWRHGLAAKFIRLAHKRFEHLKTGR